MSAETPGIDSDKNRDTKTSTSKTPPATPTTTIPPFEKGGLGGIPGGSGGIIPREPEWIHHLDIWTAAETEKKSGRGRNSGNGVSVYGIQKLRELILELAVRGKLVPQDPNDEPASELIKRIQIEKAKLIAKGKIKKDKPIPPILDEEKPFELPQGWEWVRLGEVYSLEYGDNLPSNKRSNTGEYPVYGSNGIVGSHNVAFVNSTCIVVGRKGSAGALNLSLSNGCCVTDVAYYCIPPKCLDIVFSFKLFHTLSLDSLGKGIKPGLNRNEAYELLIAIPPLPEQHRIVTKVDGLMALCDQLETQHSNAAEAHEKLVNHLLGTLTQSQSADDFSANWQRIAAHFDTLFTTEASIDALKQTLLQLAVMGKLVPQNPTDEPASELLKRIQAEKARLVAEGKIKKGKSPLTPLLPRGGTGSVAATSINPTTTTLSTPPLSNSTPNPNSTPPFEKGGPGGIQRGISEEEKLFELPQGWEWVKFIELLGKIGAGSTPLGGKQVYVNSGIPFLRSQNVWNEGLRLDDVAFITLETHQKMSGTHVYAGDLLFNITGASIGRCSIVPDNFEVGNVSQHVTIVRPLSKEILLFLHLVLISKHVQQTVMDVQVGVSREGLSIGKLGQFIIPIPPLEEQHRIVAKVDELMVLCDQLKSTITQARQLQKKLADVVVEQAIAF